MRTLAKLLFLSSVFFLTACQKDQHTLDQETPADMSAYRGDYRLVSSNRTTYSPSTNSHDIFYSDCNTTYVYDDKGYLIRSDATFSPSYQKHYTASYSSDYTTITSANSETIDDATYLLSKTISSPTRNVYYQNIEQSTEGYDTITIEERTENYRLLSKSLDGKITFSFFGLFSPYAESFRIIPANAPADTIPDATLSYSYDSSGNLTAKYYDLDHDGITDYTILYTYDVMNGVKTIQTSDNNLTEYTRTYNDVGSILTQTRILNQNLVETLRYTYNERKQRTAQYLTQASGEETNTSYIYSDSGILLHKTVSTSDGQIRYTDYTFNTEGKLIHFESTLEWASFHYNDFLYRYAYFSGGSLPTDFAAFEFSYDDNGNIDRLLIYDNADGNLTSETTFVWQAVESAE